METGVVIYKSMAVVENRRKAANIPAIVQSLNSIEKSVFTASTGKMVAEYTDAQLVEELAKALRTVFRDVGYKATDDSEYKYIALRLAVVLRRYYGQMTMQEFRLAFEMSVVGELDAYLPRRADGQADRGHYQQFSTEYACKIINAYRSKRDAVLKKAEKAMPKNGVETSEVEAAKEATRRDLVAAYEYFRENGRLPSLSPVAEMLYYDLLAEAGLAPKVKVTEAEREEILRKTIDGFLAKGYTGDANDLKQQGTSATSIQYDAFALARRKNLRDTFARLVAQGTDITDFIKTN